LRRCSFAAVLFGLVAAHLTCFFEGILRDLSVIALEGRFSPRNPICLAVLPFWQFSCRRSVLRRLLAFLRVFYALISVAFLICRFQEKKAYEKSEILSYHKKGEVYYGNKSEKD
jgi:hypothetical protein